MTKYKLRALKNLRPNKQKKLREKCAYLSKCIWWASVLCQTWLYTPKLSFCFFSPKMPDMSKSYLCWGQHNNVITWLNMRCDLTNRCTKHKGPWVSFFVLVFSYLYHDCGLLFLISKKCYFTAVVSYFCKQFANQNAMYSRYGLYFRFTALPAVCKYDRINEWKESTLWGCAVSTSSMMLCGLLKLNTEHKATVIKLFF